MRGAAFQTPWWWLTVTCEAPASVAPSCSGLGQRWWIVGGGWGSAATRRGAGPLDVRTFPPVVWFHGLKLEWCVTNLFEGGPCGLGGPSRWVVRPHGWGGLCRKRLLRSSAETEGGELRIPGRCCCCRWWSRCEVEDRFPRVLVQKGLEAQGVDLAMVVRCVSRGGDYQAREGFPSARHPPWGGSGRMWGCVLGCSKPFPICHSVSEGGTLRSHG